MTIELKKFGTTLISRQNGREAFAAFAPRLSSSTDGDLIVDFEGVLTFSPSWGDEFLTPLFKQFGKRLILKDTQNPSVVATMRILERANNEKFTIQS